MGITNVAQAWWHFALIAACILLAATLSACGGNSDVVTAEKVLSLEAKLHSLEESLEAAREESTAVDDELSALQQENEALKSELSALRQAQTTLVQSQRASAAIREYREEEADYEEGQEQQLADLEEDQVRTGDRIDDLDSRLQELEEIAAQLELVLPAIERWFTGMDERVKLLEGTDIGRTLRLAETGGGQAQVINYGAAYGGARSAVLVLPDKLPEGEIPLIVSLHGFGSDSFIHSRYIPLHQRVNRDGFALLLPDGVENAEGQRFWNPTDGFGKADHDDINALIALVQEARGELDVGPVYVFGYSNGGFMAYYLACKGLPGLRAVASLAGTSYMDDEACEGAAPVSVLHIHSADDAVVLFDGIAGETSAADKNEPGYAGAQDMVRRWGQRAGCNVQSVAYGLGVDLDDAIEGPETLTYAFPEGCAEGITVEMWSSDEGGHTPGYGDAFTDALLEWLLAQK